MLLTLEDKKIEHGVVYTSDIFEKKIPHIKSNQVDKTQYYTTIIVDPDAPYPSEPTSKYMVHLLVVNSTDIKLEYHPPNPPIDSPPHRYQVFLYLQPKYIQMEKMKYAYKFNLDEFVSKWDLKLVDQFEFLCKKK